MQHTSIQMNVPVEIVALEPSDISPFIQKATIKVCYVSDKPNRNQTIITKQSANYLAKSLRGSPIVGFYNEELKDFETHNRELEIKDGKIVLKDVTKPYGFVDINAKIWFAKYLDDNQFEREYLVTEGWIWTGVYEESQRISKGNNQSMELDKKLSKGHWTNEDNDNIKFFIFNEPILKKLCILGENNEPCFEGASISFSLDTQIKEELYNLINKGETVKMELENNLNTESTEDFATQEGQKEEKTCPKCGKPVSECTCEDKKANDNSKDDDTVNSSCKKKHEEYEAIIAEKDEQIAAFSSQISELNSTIETLNSDCQKKYEEYEAIIAEKDSQNVTFSSQISELNSTIETLNQQITALQEFKYGVEKTEKMNLINSFTMLSDEEKKEVIENVDKYSLYDIKAKLSIICVENKVNFSVSEEIKEEEQSTTYSLNTPEEDNTPAWVKAIRATSQNM